MALNRRLSTPKALQHSLVQHFGQITGDGTTAPSVFEMKGVTSIGRTGVGILTVVLPGTGTVELLSCTLTCLSANDRLAMVQSYVAATRTLTVRIEDAAAANTDLTSSDKLFIHAVVKNSSAP